MYNLFVTLLKDKQYKRHVSLLNYLNKMRYGATSKNLADQLGVSTPTIREDIRFLSNNYASQIEITTPKKEGEGYTLTFHDGWSLDQLLLLLARQTPTFQIILSTLFQKDWSVEKALSNLSISSSSYTRLIKHMNGILARFDLSITASPLKLVGNESDKRAFFFCFFINFGDSHIVYDRAQRDAFRLIALLEEKEAQPLNYSLFRSSLLLSIIKIRRSSKQFVAVPEHLIDEVTEGDNFHYFSKSLLLDAQMSNLPNDELLWAYFASLDCITYGKHRLDPHKLSRFFDRGGEVGFGPDYKANKLLKKHRYRRNTPPKLLAEVGTFIHTIVPGLSKLKLAYIKLESYMINMRLLSQLSHNFEYIYPEVLHNMRERHTQLFHQVLDELLHLERRSDSFSFRHHEHIAACLTMLFLSAKVNHAQEPLRVLFAFQGPAGYDDILYREAHHHLADRSKIDYLYGYEALEEMIEVPDLIVTNYELRMPGQIKAPLLRLSTIPTLSDWEELVRTVTQMEKNPPH